MDQIVAPSFCLSAHLFRKPFHTFRMRSKGDNTTARFIIPPGTQLRLSDHQMRQRQGSFPVFTSLTY
ncbi:hypothetical protein DKP76_09585 [Falsochrobactrum shanghaiense]|uniref:Uncharacterized protein n=1 Tax=Falsochrobactrum shanghaiense TaxID=2201899 RepID=A0A316JFL7_9HYPH|nr:hypothetical protein DKP76_09585 [Falsochrobactrum shanghaiense]